MKIALVENFGADFYGARLRYGLFLKQKGHEVIAIVPNDGYVDRIRSEGIITIAINVDIRKRNLKTAAIYASELKRIFKKEKFDCIHLYRMQPNLIGTAVAYFTSKNARIINHITGLGVAFTKTTLKYNMIRYVIKSAYKLNSILFNAILVFQNQEDKEEIGSKIEYLVVKGSAVNEDQFNVTVEPNLELKKELKEKHKLQDGTTLIFVSRLLKQKGLAYLIKALEKLNKSAPLEKKFNLIVAGWIDPNNPDSFTESEIHSFEKVDGVVFLGKRNDIDQLISIADVAVLPTFYREGTPRFLLEAMAMGKTILTTDMPGCNHLVKEKKNGWLVKPQSVEELVNAFKNISCSNLEEMGVISREIYENEFSENVVYNQLLNAYNR